MYETGVFLNRITNEWDIIIWFSQDSPVIIEESWEFSKILFGLPRWRACSAFYVVVPVSPKCWPGIFSILKVFVVVLWKLLKECRQNSQVLSRLFWLECLNCNNWIFQTFEIIREQKLVLTSRLTFSIYTN